MGKSLPTSGIKNFSRIISSDRIKNPPKQQPKPKPTSLNTNPKHSAHNRIDSVATRVPLSMAVTDCVRRWFGDTLKEARNGDTSMQVLVGQMYNSGYGVPKDPQKGHAWITRASKGRSSAWRVSNKQPGYNASDSDSEDLEDARS